MATHAFVDLTQIVVLIISFSSLWQTGFWDERFSCSPRHSQNRWRIEASRISHSGLLSHLALKNISRRDARGVENGNQYATRAVILKKSYLLFARSLKARTTWRAQLFKRRNVQDDSCIRNILAVPSRGISNVNCTRELLLVERACSDFSQLHLVTSLSIQRVKWTSSAVVQRNPSTLMINATIMLYFAILTYLWVFRHNSCL